LKVVHINQSDTKGGAAIAAFRLHNAMLKNGIDSKYLVLRRTINDRSDIRTVSKYARYITRSLNFVLEKFISWGVNNKRGLYSPFLFGVDVSKYQEVKESDSIYLHWICGSFFNFTILRKILKTGKPVFWFMHDMFPITGGCHYSFECTKYYTGCYECPFHKKRAIFPDISRRQFSLKQKIYKQFDNFIFIAPSAWLADCAKKSGLTRDKQVYHIPNLIDFDRFKIVDKIAARRLYSIKNNAKIIAFGADNALSNPYKGWSYFRDSLRLLSKEPQLEHIAIEALIFGSSYNRKISEDIPFPSYFLGQLHDEYSMVMMYNCIDVFVISSLADNFPNTILESLACNIPVVGFNVGGIPDMINEHTGYLAEYKNSDDLAKGIAFLLTTGKKDIRTQVIKFSSAEIIKRHEHILYNTDDHRHETER
jgi:glycosyltransferase involved in cell wall biosynthesis